MKFVGRSPQLAELENWYSTVSSGGSGLMVAVRGRRQVGKSRLYTEFLRRHRLPNIFFTAIKDGSSITQMQTFQRDCLLSTPPIPDADALFAAAPSGWPDIFGRLRIAAQTSPIVVVLDELPWATEADPELEGELQSAWDRYLQHLPILLVLIGSDVSMMERLTAHDRPLYGRAREDRVRPFNPAEVAAALGRHPSPMAVFDAYLATGGYPKLVADFAAAGTLDDYVRAGFSDENSDLIVVAQRSLDAEFPPKAQARRILSAIGGQEVGHATFSSVLGRFDEGAAGTTGVAISRALKVLTYQKDVISISVPAGQAPNSKLRRYRVSDPYLRFWFYFVEPYLAHIARGRSDVALKAFAAGWESWRGRAIEPEVQAALERLAPGDPELGSSTAVGSWWNRDNSVEVDVVVHDHRSVYAVGSVKWRERKAFSAHELSELTDTRAVIPHAAGAALLAVCPAGLRPGVSVDRLFTAEDLLTAWSA